jgi:hypothetical protein
MKILKINLNHTLLLAAAFSLVLNSCNKKDDIDNDTAAAKNESVAEKTFNEVNDIADQASKTGNLNGFKIDGTDGILASDCAIITIDTSSFVSASNPDTVIIDFGTGCVGNDGKNRSGKIIVSATGRYRDVGTIITMTPVNYIVNGNAISGYRRVTNSGLNASNQPIFQIEVNGTIVLANDGGTITWTANRTRVWTEGFNTPLIFNDDVFSVTGGSNGTKASGTTWTNVINTPLVHKRSCHQIVSGTMTVTPSNKPVRTIDFGTGACDSQATVTINGNTYTIVVQ